MSGNERMGKRKAREANVRSIALWLWSRPMAAVLWVYETFKLTWIGFERDVCFQRAAGLAFTSVFALVPLVAIFLFVFDVTGGLSLYRERAQQLILEQIAPESQVAVGGFIDNLVDKIREYSTSSGVLGLIGFAVFGILLLDTIESVFNDIWKVPKYRPILQRVTVFSAVLCLVPVSVAASVYLKSRVETSVIYHEVVMGNAPERLFYHWVAPLLLTIVSFLVPFLYLPNTRVSFRYGFAAALLAGSMWQTAKWGFKLYLAHTVSYYRIFGSIAAIPIFLLWIYVTWIIVLFGAEFSHVLQHKKALRNAPPVTLRSSSLPVDTLAVLFATELARRSEAGLAPLSSEDMALRLGALPAEAFDVMRRLEEARLVERVKNRELLALARPASEIRVAEVLRAVDAGIPSMDKHVPSELRSAMAHYQHVRFQARQVFAELTLKDLLELRLPEEKT